MENLKALQAYMTAHEQMVAAKATKEQLADAAIAEAMEYLSGRGSQVVRLEAGDIVLAFKKTVVPSAELDDLKRRIKAETKRIAAESEVIQALKCCQKQLEEELGSEQVPQLRCSLVPEF